MLIGRQLVYRTSRMLRHSAMECVSRGNGNPLIRGVKRLLPPVAGWVLVDMSNLRIEVYQGLLRSCGHLGPVQGDFNVTGHVHGGYPLRSLTYRVNGGNPRPLAFKRSKRIVEYGDFNAD